MMLAWYRGLVYGNRANYERDGRFDIVVRTTCKLLHPFQVELWKRRLLQAWVTAGYREDNESSGFNFFWTGSLLFIPSYTMGRNYVSRTGIKRPPVMDWCRISGGACDYRYYGEYERKIWMFIVSASFCAGFFLYMSPLCLFCRCTSCNKYDRHFTRILIRTFVTVRVLVSLLFVDWLIYLTSYRMQKRTRCAEIV